MVLVQALEIVVSALNTVQMCGLEVFLSANYKVRKKG